MEELEDKRFVYEFGKFVLDPNEKRLFANGEPIRLPAKEFETLLLLVEHNGTALSKEEMIAAIWPDAFVEEGNLAKQVWKLRKVLNTNGDQFIETLPKHGYRFSADLRVVETEFDEPIIFEKRTVKRMKFAVERQFEDEHSALPPRRARFYPSPWFVFAFLAVIGLGFLVWRYGPTFFASGAAAVDPYAAIRLTDDPNDDTHALWTRDGRIRFGRYYPDGRQEIWIMNPDGSDPQLVSAPGERFVFSWSPDGQKLLFRKNGDATKTYLSKTDGSGEILLSFREGEWSPDSKWLAYRQRVAGDNSDIFVYSLETGESRNVTNNEHFDADPSFSPDGRQIVFSSNRDGNNEIYVTDLDGTGLRRLTNDPHTDSHASFSPDGTQILFNSNRENENNDVYLMHADGSGIVKVTNWDKTNETADRGAWSLDGTKIAFTSDRNGKDDIYVVSAETIRPKLLLSEADSDLGAPSYSPDGKKFVYSRGSADRSGEIRIFDRDAKTTSIVTKTELPTASAHWSPDSNWIVFSNRMNGNSDVFRIRPDGSGLENLTNDPLSDFGSAISPDGNQIVFVTTRGPGANLQLYTMNFDGSGARPITPRKGWESDPTWSPDGSSIIFVCDRTDSPGNMLDLCEINTDGTEERRLLFRRNHEAQPAVSPDGKRIVFTSRSDGNVELYLINRDGTGLRRLTRHPAEDHSPRWSPDGSSIIFTSNRAGKFAIYEIEELW